MRSQINAPGTMHHIIVRWIEGLKIFIDDTERKTSWISMAGVQLSGVRFLLIKTS